MRGKLRPFEQSLKNIWGRIRRKEMCNRRSKEGKKEGSKQAEAGVANEDREGEEAGAQQWVTVHEHPKL